MFIFGTVVAKAVNILLLLLLLYPTSSVALGKLISYAFNFKLTQGGKDTKLRHKKALNLVPK